jgi:hypothetical protein
MALPPANALATMRANCWHAEHDGVKGSATAFVFFLFECHFAVDARDKTAESRKECFLTVAHAIEDFAHHQIQLIGCLSWCCAGAARHFLNDFGLLHPISLYQSVLRKPVAPTKVQVIPLIC